MKPKNFQEFFNQYLFKRDTYIQKLESQMKIMKDTLKVAEKDHGFDHIMCTECYQILDADEYGLGSVSEFCSQCRVAICDDCFADDLNGVWTCTPQQSEWTDGYWLCNKHSQ